MSDTTDLTVHQSKTELVAGGDVAGLIPQTIEEAYRLATAMFKSGMAPKTLDSTEKCLVAIMAGAEIGLAPFQATQAFAIINQRPVLWGDAMLAVVLRNGFKVNEWFDDDDAPTKASCEVTRPDNGQVILRTYSVDDAKKANLIGKQGPWATNQKRMLQMRARAFACRDGASDALKGFAMREEVTDYTEIRSAAAPQKSDLRARLEASKEPATEGFTVENGEHVTPTPTLDEILGGDDFPVIHDAEIIGVDSATGEDHTAVATIEDGVVTSVVIDPQDWAVTFNGLLDPCTDEAEIDALLALPEHIEGFRALEAASPAMAKALNAAINGKRKAVRSRLI